MAITLLPSAPAEAKPTPSRKELTAQEKQLANQLEQMTEQYNGLQVRLKQAQRAAKVAADSAKIQQQGLATAQAKIAQMAASSYKNGGVDPAVAFASAKDPQTMLDQSATLNYFTSQGSLQVRTLFQTLQSTARAQKAAQDRTDQVTGLAKELQQK